MTIALEISNLQAWYGESHILHDVNISVKQGEVVTLLGRNGAGLTTTLRAIMGLVGTRKGSIVVHDASGQGVETIDLPTHKIAHCGIGYCPEERGIFSSLSCEENLMLPPVLKGQVAKTGNAGMSIDEIYEMFPNLAERRQSQGTRLSGGEQQMLAIARILRTGAKMLLLDEPTASLDAANRAVVVELIGQKKHQGVAMVAIVHDDEIRHLIADRIVDVTSFAAAA